MKEERNVEVHNTGAALTTSARDVPVTELRPANRSHPAYGFHWTAPVGTPPPTIRKETYFFKGRSELAIETCRSYIALLEKLVWAFDATYPDEANASFRTS